MASNSNQLATIEALNQSVTDPSLAFEMAAGMAAQLIAQSTAQVVAAGAQYVQGMTTFGLAAMATLGAGAVYQTGTKGDPNSPDRFITAMQDIQTQVQDASQVYQALGTSAAAVVTAFKSA